MRVRTTPFVPDPAAGSVRLATAPPGLRPPGCRQWEGYVPDSVHPEFLPVRLIRVNFHVMDKADSTAHRPADAARAFLRQLLELANVALDTNPPNWRSPAGTPTLPKRYRYVLTPQPLPGDDGIYFHYDDSLYYFVSSGKYQNNYDRTVIQKYGIGLDSILNIFIQVHPRDSFASSTYRPNSQGIALGTALKMAGLLERKYQPEAYDGLLNHEVGHILGLGHAWVEDGCPDTDHHPNQCWTASPDPPCRDQATNNTMDYNDYQIALTPCQIGKVHATLANERSAVRRCLVPTWCALHEDRSLVIRDSVSWTGARDLEGHISVAPGAILRLSCRVSMPPGGRITVQPGGCLQLDGAHLHNACGFTWAGIFVQEQNGRKGTVQLLNHPVIENIEGGLKVE